MKFSTRFVICVAVMTVLALGAGLFVASAGAQDEGWWIVRAEYGTRSQHNDVTDIVKELIGRGGVNGRVAVNNQTMGGDPAVGADKVLRIWVRNARNEQREFEYREGGFVPVEMVVARREERRPDRDDLPASYGGPERRDSDALQIVRAYYGVQGRTINVTEIVRSQLRGNSINLLVANRTFGADPAVGADKVLIVVYSYNGAETASAVPEGNTLTLP